jgi:Family of unknown function (DUF5678)
MMTSATYEEIREWVMRLPDEALNAVRSALLLPSEEQQKLLAELKARRPIKVRRIEPRDFSVEQQWLQENRHLYRGQYIAVSGDELVANGIDPREVMKKPEPRGRISCYLESRRRERYTAGASGDGTPTFLFVPSDN